MSTRSSDTGVDPLGCYIEFIKKDVVENLDKNKEEPLNSKLNS